MEEPESRLRNLYRNYEFRNRDGSLKNLSKVDKLRWLGGMEALLQCVGKLPSGIPFDYQVEKKTFLFIPFHYTESYETFIVRNCREHIQSSSNTPPQ